VSTETRETPEDAARGHDPSSTGLSPLRQAPGLTDDFWDAEKS